jgi:hypothetical protein
MHRRASNPRQAHTCVTAARPVLLAHEHTTSHSDSSVPIPTSNWQFATAYCFLTCLINKLIGCAVFNTDVPVLHEILSE